MASGAETRNELIRAGVELNDELTIERLFAGVTTAAVAARAGVTTGSFFHHFANSSEFAAALVRSQFRERLEAPAVTGELVEAVASGELARSLAIVLTSSWQGITSNHERRAERRAQMHLFAHHRAALPVDGEHPEWSTVGDVLRDTYRHQFDGIALAWQQILDLTEMRLEAPFNTHRLAISVHALMLGLEIIDAIDPTAVDDQLFADTAATLAGAASRLDLRVPRVVVADELGQATEASPQARSGARRRQDTRNRIVEATSGMFDHGWDHLSATDVAEVSGVSTQTVINLFGQVRLVCAATFVRHLPSYRRAIDAAMPDRPMDALHDALLHLARAAAADPHPARALLVERLGIRTSRHFDLADDDIRVLVPFGIRLAFVIAAIRDADVGEPSVADLSATLIDTVLAHAIPRPGRSEETVELALRLLDHPGPPDHPGDSGS
ncbi:MAG: TetR/AcrR family transcriptional regulator [Actinobacteria bacterium]|nr:TetR/AcrR family transcriptional regulator [Actinomycetota bacterium]